MCSILIIHDTLWVWIETICSWQDLKSIGYLYCHGDCAFVTSITTPSWHLALPCLAVPCRALPCLALLRITSRSSGIHLNSLVEVNVTSLPAVLYQILHNPFSYHLPLHPLFMLKLLFLIDRRWRRSSLILDTHPYPCWPSPPLKTEGCRSSRESSPPCACAHL